MTSAKAVERPGEYRSEADFLGSVDVPARAYYGAQTSRAIANFKISGTPISEIPELIKSLAQVKKAAAIANNKLGDLSDEKFRVIVTASDEIVDGKLVDQFPIDVFQGGAGTSTNMNVNEVIANRALELLGFERGRYDIINPNNDVNLSQSTNDVYPTAIRLTLISTARQLIMSIRQLAGVFTEKGDEFSSIVKVGRTQLQDAVPMTLGQEFQAFASSLQSEVAQLETAVTRLYEVNLGGTAIGTAINADPQFSEMVIRQLAEITHLPLVRATDLIAASWDTGEFVSLASSLKRTAIKISKICNDLRLLASGPRGGLAEIVLPALQSGSSIMPGKFNPVIPEAVNQVAFHVIGAELTVTLAAEAGQLQLNAFEPVIVYSLVKAMTLMSAAMGVLKDCCVRDISANAERCGAHLEASTALVTPLSPMLGYVKATEFAREILASGNSLRTLLERDQIFPPDMLDLLLNPVTLTRPRRLR